MKLFFIPNNDVQEADTDLKTFPMKYRKYEITDQSTGPVRVTTNSNDTTEKTVSFYWEDLAYGPDAHFTIKCFASNVYQREMSEKIPYRGSFSVWYYQYKQYDEQYQEYDYANY
jgi:hypothetical protein